MTTSPRPALGVPEALGAGNFAGTRVAHKTVAQAIASWVSTRPERGAVAALCNDAQFHLGSSAPRQHREACCQILVRSPGCSLFSLDPPRTRTPLPAALQSRLQGSTQHRAGRTTAWPLSRFGSAHQPFFRPACAKRCPARAERSQLRTAAFTPAPRLWSLGKIENLYYYRYDSTVYYYSRLMDCYWENIYEHRAPPQKLEKTRQSMKKKIF